LLEQLADFFSSASVCKLKVFGTKEKISANGTLLQLFQLNLKFYFEV